MLEVESVAKRSGSRGETSLMLAVVRSMGLLMSLRGPVRMPFPTSMCDTALKCCSFGSKCLTCLKVQVDNDSRLSAACDWR